MAADKCALKGFRAVDPFELEGNVFQQIGKDFFEIVVRNGDENPNAMTAGWGGLGIMWNYPVAFVVVRGEKFRFSRHLLDQEPLFSMCFLGDDQAKAKRYLGSTHGWDDPNKIASAGLTCGWYGVDMEHDDRFKGTHVHVPFIEESQLVLMCEKICAQELPQETVLDSALWEKVYSVEDQHVLYIVRIRSAWVKE